MTNYCKCPKILIIVDNLHISHAKSTKKLHARDIYVSFAWEMAMRTLQERHSTDSQVTNVYK